MIACTNRYLSEKVSLPLLHHRLFLMVWIIDGIFIFVKIIFGNVESGVVTLRFLMDRYLPEVSSIYLFNQYIYLKNSWFFTGAMHSCYSSKKKEFDIIHIENIIFIIS